jgi:hypothetical protein
LRNPNGHKREGDSLLVSDQFHFDMLVKKKKCQKKMAVSLAKNGNFDIWLPGSSKDGHKWKEFVQIP